MRMREIPATCRACSAPLQFPFVRVRVDLVIAKPDAARQVAGLATMFRGAIGIAEAFAPDPEVALCAGDEKPQLISSAFVCMDCACGDRVTGLAMTPEREADAT